jgi:hypothetical protein
MRHTCNKGLTNTEYKSTPQDLTDEKGGEDSGMQAQGIQDKALARSDRRSPDNTVLIKQG